jgi:hypothetical protein
MHTSKWADPAPVEARGWPIRSPEPASHSSKRHLTCGRYRESVIVPSFIIELDSRGYVETGEESTPLAEVSGLSVPPGLLSVPRHRRSESVEVLVRPDVVVPDAEEIEVFLPIPPRLPRPGGR